MILYSKWKAFHNDNPQVFWAFYKYAREAAEVKKSFGARMVWERIRWHSTIETDSKDGFKLNNNHICYYARFLAVVDPARFDGFFTTREGSQTGPDEELQMLRDWQNKQLLPWSQA